MVKGNFIAAITISVAVLASFAAEAKNFRSFTATCITQQHGNLITAVFNDDPGQISNVDYGDRLDLTAAACPQHKASVTAVSIKVTGKVHMHDAKPPIYRHYIVGEPIAETGKTWSFAAKCIVQQQGSTFIAAVFNDDPEHAMAVELGDMVDLTAPACPEYPGYITAVKIRVTGKAHDPLAQPPQYTHFIIGNPS